MSEAQRIVHIKDWNGGYLSILGTSKKITSADQIEPTVLIFRDGKTLGCATVEGERRANGVDHDHGRDIEWSSFDLNITLPPIGFGVTARELIARGYELWVFCD